MSAPKDFKAYASKFDLNKSHKKQGIFSRKPAKNAPKSMIFLYYPFVTIPLKSATSQNFPIIFTKMSLLQKFNWYINLISCASIEKISTFFLN